MTSQPALCLHNALCNIAQNIVHVHRFLKISCFQPWRFNRGNTWMKHGVTIQQRQHVDETWCHDSTEATRGWSMVSRFNRGNTWMKRGVTIQQRQHVYETWCRDSTEATRGWSMVSRFNRGNTWMKHGVSRLNRGNTWMKHGVAIQQRQHVDEAWCRMIFSGLISMLVFGIFKIHGGCIQIGSGCTAATCTVMATGLPAAIQPPLRHSCPFDDPPTASSTQLRCITAPISSRYDWRFHALSSST